MPAANLVRFRRMRPDDIARVLEIDAANPRPATVPDATWQDALVEGRVDVAVADVGGLVIGFAAFKDFRKFVHMYRVAVSPEFRRRGVGPALLRRLVRSGWRRGREHIQANLRVEDVASRAIYRRAGFDRHNVARDYYAPGEHADQMICVCEAAS